MTHSEIDLLEDLTSRPLGKRWGDYLIANTDENWAVVEAALAWFAGRRKNQCELYSGRGVMDKILTNEYLLHGYLTAKAIRELRESAK